MPDLPPVSGPRLIQGLREIADGHDALICDVWGVLHDGARVFPAAADALARFRKTRGPVILLTNAPRTPAEVAAQCAAYGVPDDCYDAIVSSGGAAREELERRSAEAQARAGASGKKDGSLPLYYIGPDRDLPMIEGLDVRRAPVAEAQVALCIGLVDDMAETPEDYAGILAAMRGRDLPMLCANPDIKVLRGAHMVWCAGALARDYEALGGTVIYFGKPHAPVYRAALARAAEAAHGKSAENPLAIGDGLFTDVRGANAAGLPVLFIADGIHGEEVEPYSSSHLADLFRRNNVSAGAASRALTW